MYFMRVRRVFIKAETYIVIHRYLFGLQQSGYHFSFPDNVIADFSVYHF